MSIYITNMDIPKDEAVALYIYPDGRVKLWRPQAAVSHEYEAVPVPPHGKLIEAEPIMKFITDGLNSGKFGYDQIEVLTEIQYAPTIIPAEEGE